MDFISNDVFRVMQIVVLADDQSKKEFLANGADSRADIQWISSQASFLNYKNADAFIDMLFDNTQSRINVLCSLLPKPVLINSVPYTLSESNGSFIRFNGWKTFLSSSIVESSASEERKIDGEQILSIFNKKPHWLPDAPGFATPRVVSMIINEAFIAFSEGVSTKNDIDTAMKLGTNYPYGPFEWAELIGKENIVSLLKILSVTAARYQPSKLLLHS